MAVDIRTAFERAAREARRRARTPPVRPPLARRAATGHRHGVRTLVGTAIRFDETHRVTGLDRRRYAEEWAPTSLDRTLAERSWWPLHLTHERGPVGFVEFYLCDDRLVFVATLDRSDDADRVWRLQQLGQLREVSIRGTDMAPAIRLDPEHGQVVVRSDFTIEHLALCYNGTAQLPYARVDHLRHDRSEPSAETLTRWRLVGLERTR